MRHYEIIWRVGAKTFSFFLWEDTDTPFQAEDNSGLTVMLAFSLSLATARGKKRRQQTFIGLVSGLGKVNNMRLQRQTSKSESG